MNILYPLWLIIFALGLALAYLSPLGLPIFILFSGIISLWAFKSIKNLEIDHKALIAIIFIFFILIILRSDTEIAINLGVNYNKAISQSNNMHWTPIVLGISGILALLGLRLFEEKKGRNLLSKINFFVIAFILIMAAEAISQGSLSNYWRTQIYHTNRPERIIVWLSDSNTVLLLLFWPIAYGLARAKQAFLAPLIAVVIIALALKCDTNAQIVALIASGVVFGLFQLMPRQIGFNYIRSEHLFGTCLALGIVGFPLALSYLFQLNNFPEIKEQSPESWSQRLDIWQFTMNMAEKKWLTGWGYESARLFDPYIPSHPHSMALQAYLEFGIVGLLSLSAFWYLAALSLAKLKAPNWVTISCLPYTMAGLSSIYIINSLSYGLWRSWLYCAAIFMIMLFILIVKYGPMPSDHPDFLEPL